MKKEYIDLDLAKDDINACVKNVDESDTSPSYKQSIKTAGTESQRYFRWQEDIDD